MLHKRTPNNFLNYFFMHVNCVSSFGLVSIFARSIYSLFFFQRTVLKRFGNNSLFSHFSYFSKNKGYSYFCMRYSFILFNRDFAYWSNIHLTRERFEPSSVINNFVATDYKKYIYVIIWCYLYYVMALS